VIESYSIALRARIDAIFSDEDFSFHHQLESCTLSSHRSPPHEITHLVDPHH
jgi:hypothetical protein